jgi:triosephosphate isomerase
MRDFVIAGNWKMHKNNSEALQLVRTLKMKTTGVKKARMVVCPPYTALALVSETLKDSAIEVGAQNLYWEKQGAFTGEISAEMILGTGASYVIIGHSERRQYFGETDETVNTRLKAALVNGLKPIVCVGESLAQREEGITNDVVGEQIRGALADISAEQAAGIIIAYEPIWAIGTGKTASPEQAQEVHAFIRSLLRKRYDVETSESMVLQYGGSVKPANAEELLSQTDIDGALVGGACLEADSFAAIIQAAEKLSK